MSLLKNSSKPITKRKPRRVYKLTSTLDAYRNWKVREDSKVRPHIQMNQGEDDSMNIGAYKLNDD